jgi:mitochondrial cardiolipin hydrolase
MNRSLSKLLFAAMLLVVGVAGCGGGGGETVGPPTALRNEDYVPEVQVQIVDHLYRVAGLSDENLNSDPIFSLIASAVSSLDIAVTRINRQTVVQALLDEARSGTQIRIVTEKAYYEDPTYQPFYAQLEDVDNNLGNISIRTDDDGMPRMMHSRFLVIDHARVVTGSYNWETEDNAHTFGDVISILNTNVAAAFTNQFNQMFVEGNFGVQKRDDTQHSFSLGGGNGLLEVYFGPTDQLRDMMVTEMNQSNYAAFFVQQFKDVELANSMFAWLQGNPESQLVGWFNDIATIGDAEENAVYDAFTNYVGATAAAGGACYINLPINDVFANYNAMNHKLMVVDHALSNNTPAVMFTTANYSQLGFTQNDEVMLILRGLPLVNKWWRVIDLSSTLPGNDVERATDVQEIDQLLAMYPYAPSIDATLLRDFPDVPCGIVFGEITNFRPTITYQDSNGDFTDLNIDVTFEIEGATYFDSTAYGPLAPTVTGDMFEESELANPNHKYLLVVPAGDVTIRTLVTAGDGAVSSLFQPDETTFTIGPGCVRNINLQINQAADPTTPGGAGGGGV